MLLLNGAGPNVVDDNGDTPLHLAACEVCSALHTKLQVLFFNDQSEASTPS